MKMKPGSRGGAFRLYDMQQNGELTGGDGLFRDGNTGEVYRHAFLGSGKHIARIGYREALYRRVARGIEQAEEFLDFGVRCGSSL